MKTYKAHISTKECSRRSTKIEICKTRKKHIKITKNKNKQSKLKNKKYFTERPGSSKTFLGKT